MYTMMKYCR